MPRVPGLAAMGGVSWLTSEVSLQCILENED